MSERFQHPALKRHHLEQALKAHERQIHSLREAQQAMAEALQGGTVMIIDNTAFGYRDVLNLNRAIVEHSGDVGRQYVHYLLETVFRGPLPRDIEETFRLFLGNDVAVQSVKTETTHAEQIVQDPKLAAIVLTGSNASVVKALDHQHYQDLAHSKTKLNHKQLLLANQQVMQAASARGIPVIGICYGLQASAYHHGGTIEPHHPSNQPRYGLETIAPTDYSTEFLLAALNLAPTDQPTGQSLISHTEHVTHPTPQSAVILRSTSDGRLSGLISAPDAHFTGDAQHDAQHLQAVLGQGQGAVLGLQYHPELDVAGHLIEFSARCSSPELVVPRPDEVQLTTANSLRLIQHFITAHPRNRQ